MEVRYETMAIKDLKTIDAKARTQIIAKINQYGANSSSLTNKVTRLVGSPFYRLRVGDYRVIFSLTGEGVVIMTVLTVKHRKKAYD